MTAPAPEPHWPLAEAAKRWAPKGGITATVLRNAITAGKLEASKVGRIWLVTDRAMEAFLAGGSACPVPESPRGSSCAVPEAVPSGTSETDGPAAAQAALKAKLKLPSRPSPSTPQPSATHGPGVVIPLASGSRT